MERIRKESLTEAAGAYKAAFVEVQQLKTEVDLAKGGTSDSITVIDHYSGSMDLIVGVAKNVEEVERILNEKEEAYIKFKHLTAAPIIAQQKAADAAFKKESLRQQITCHDRNHFYIDPRDCNLGAIHNPISNH